MPDNNAIHPLKSSPTKLDFATGTDPPPQDSTLDNVTSHSQQVTSSKSRNNGFSNSYVTDADIWKKTLEAHNEHEKFLEKIGLSTTTTSLKNARFLNSGKPPSFALISTAGSRNRSNLKTPTVFATKSVVDGSKDNISASLDTSKLFQEFYASTKTRTFNNLAENTTALWRSGVDGFQHPIDIRRNIAFRTFHLTGGEPPKTPPHVASEELTPIRSGTTRTLFHNKKRKKFNFRGTDAMFAFDNPFETKKEIHPTTDYSNVTPRIDTGLSQIRQVGKFTSTGLPVLDDTHHPLTIGSRFKPFNYDNYRAKRQSRINDVTNRLYNNLGSIKHIRHLYSPASQQHHGLMQMMPPGIGGKDRTEIKVLPPAAATATPIPSSNVGVKPAVVAAASPFRAPGGGGTQSDHRPHHAFQATVTSRYAQNRGSGYGSMGQNKFGAPNSTAPTTITTGKKYRPSQLLPIHIPGPKHENIYIGTYTEEVERESGKNTRESGVPMKSRKR